MYTKQIIDLIEQYGPQMQPGNQFFTRAVLSNDQILGAISSFAKGANPDAIVGMIDDSLKKDGTAGIVFTTSCIYFSNVGVKGMSVKNAMVRYCDIRNAKIITKKWSDYSNVIQLNICNLPYDFYEISNITFKKEPFRKFIEALLEILKKEDNFEKDSKPSYSVVSHYLQQRDMLMKDVLSSVRNGKKIDKSIVSVTDAFGLTPLHYCIAFGDMDNAYRILKDTLKKNREMYVCRQPYGIYNYCMSIVMSGCDLDSDKNGLFYEIFLCTDEMRTLEKEYNKALVKEEFVEAGKALVSEMISQIEFQREQSLTLAEDKIEQAEIQINNINSNNFAEVQKRKEEIEKAKRVVQRKKEEWGFGQNDDEMQDSEKDDFNADFDDYYEAVVDESDSVDSVDLSSSKAIKEHMVDLANQHFEECENVFLKLKKTIDEGIQPEDERTQLLLHMFKDSSFIEKRLEAVSDDNVILRIRYKYFMVPKCFLEIFPHLKDCIAVFN